MNQDKIQADWPRPGTWLRRVAILLCLVTGVVFTIRATTGRALATSTGSESSVTQIPIERIQLGQRVVGRNPLREQTQVQAEIDPATWRRVDLETEQEGVRYDLSFLRPLSWIKSQGAVEGGTFDLVMDEIGINGPVRVVRISAFPPIEPDDHTGRSVVTGTMSHPAENILSVDIQGEAKPLGVTTTHPMWSVDQNRFVVAGELKIGERLRREDGTHAQVTRITPHRGPPEMVYNLEVNGEHVYHVSSGALLVHNSCGDLYHGTDIDSANDIVNNGLDVSKAREAAGGAGIDDKGLSLTSDPQVAQAWAKARAAERGKSPAVISVPRDQVPARGPGPDDYWDDGEYAIDLEDYPSVGPGIFGIVPPGGL